MGPASVPPVGRRGLQPALAVSRNRRDSPARPFQVRIEVRSLDAFAYVPQFLTEGMPYSVVELHGCVSSTSVVMSFEDGFRLDVDTTALEAALAVRNGDAYEKFQVGTLRRDGSEAITT